MAALVVIVGGRARTSPTLAVKDVASLRRCAVGFADPGLRASVGLGSAAARFTGRDWI